MMMWSVNFSPRVTEMTTGFIQNNDNWAIEKSVVLNPKEFGLFTDRIQSMGEGNVFTGVCLFTGGLSSGGVAF